MSEPDRATDYGERDTRAAYSVLVELGQVLGAFKGKYVVVGGSVPWLLLPDAKPEHIGTIDVDLELDPSALDEGQYATFVEALEKAEYKRGIKGLKPFQLRRRVEVDGGEPVAVIVDLLMPKDARVKKNKDKLVEGLRVQRVDGGEIALKNNVTKTIDGTMPDGRRNSVEMLVASIPALLVMKGYALVGRDKKKDCYDIYFAIRNYEGGIEAVAGECSKLLGDPTAVTGFKHIASKFRDREDFGPETVRIFLEESKALGEMTPEQIQTDAFEQVSAFIQVLKLP